MSFISYFGEYSRYSQSLQPKSDSNYYSVQRPSYEAGINLGGGTPSATRAGGVGGVWAAVDILRSLWPPFNGIWIDVLLLCRMRPAHEMLR